MDETCKCSFSCAWSAWILIFFYLFAAFESAITGCGFSTGTNVFQGLFSHCVTIVISG